MSNERMRNDTEERGVALFSETFPDSGAPAGDVAVIHGVHAHTFPIAGMTVARARGELMDRLNIDPGAVAVVDGRQADESTVLEDGQVLNFVKHAGEKGWRS